MAEIDGIPDRQKLWRSSAALGNVVRSASPLILSNLFAAAFNLVDIIMCGWIGKGDLAAFALANTVYNPVVYFGLFLVSSMFPVIGHMVGRRQTDAISSVLPMAALLITLVSIPLLVVLSFGGWAMRIFGIDSSLAGQAEHYLSEIGFGLWFILMFGVLRNFAAALGRAKAGAWVYVYIFPIKVMLNYVLIFGHLGAPSLGLRGLAIANNLSNAAACLSMAAYCWRTPTLRQHAVTLKVGRLGWSVLRELVALGLPAAAGIVADVGMFAVATLLVGSFDSGQLVAYAIARQCASLSFQVLLGLGQALTIRVGTLVGAGRIRETEFDLVAGLSLTALWLAVTGAIFCLCDRWILLVFLGSSGDNRAILYPVALFLKLATLFQIPDAIHVLFLSVLRGFKDTRDPMLIQIVGYWGIGLPAAFCLGHYAHLTGVGVWVGLMIGMAFVSVGLLARYRTVSSARQARR